MPPLLRRAAGAAVARTRLALAGEAVGPLKEEFAAAGMQLLTPGEYLDTPAG